MQPNFSIFLYYEDLNKDSHSVFFLFKFYYINLLYRVLEVFEFIDLLQRLKWLIRL